jgi:hypothetical protein
MGVWRYAFLTLGKKKKVLAPPLHYQHYQYSLDEMLGGPQGLLWA